MVLMGNIMILMKRDGGKGFMICWLYGFMTLYMVFAAS